MEAWADDSEPIGEFELLEPEEVSKPRRDPGLDALIQATDELVASFMLKCEHIHFSTWFALGY